MAASVELLEKLHEMMVQDLLTKISEGMATAADLAVAAKLLKDSNVTALAKEGSAAGALKEKLAQRAAQAGKVPQPIGLTSIDQQALDAFCERVIQ